MIELKITMIDGKEFNIRNPANSIKEFIRNAFMPDGGQLLWYEVVRGEQIQVDNIISIRELSETEVSEILDQNRIGPAPEVEEPEMIGDVVVQPQDIPSKEVLLPS